METRSASLSVGMAEVQSGEGVARIRKEVGVVREWVWPGRGREMGTVDVLN